MSRAFVFPGQGSQEVGMGRELSEAFTSARLVFEEIDDALTGNLCRCTGYRSIVDAAIKSCGQPVRNGSEAAKIRVAALLKEIKDDGIELNIPGQCYIQPKKLDVLLGILADDPESLIVSGATDSHRLGH